MADIILKLARNAIEIACGAIALVLVAILAWLFVVATPDQFSAECEILRAESANL